MTLADMNFSDIYDSRVETDLDHTTWNDQLISTGSDNGIDAFRERRVVLTDRF